MDANHRCLYLSLKLDICFSDIIKCQKEFIFYNKYLYEHKDYKRVTLKLLLIKVC